MTDNQYEADAALAKRMTAAERSALRAAIITTPEFMAGRRKRRNPLASMTTMQLITTARLIGIDPGVFVAAPAPETVRPAIKTRIATTLRRIADRIER